MRHCGGAGFDGLLLTKAMVALGVTLGTVHSVGGTSV